MTLGNMRSLGPRSLDVICTACGYHTSVNVDAYEDDVPVPSFGPRMRCTTCGHLGANVRPDWRQLRGVPGTAAVIPMAASSRKGHLSQNARRALELLTVDPRGLAEPLLLTYGLSRKMLAGLIRSGLVTTQRQTVRISGQPVEVTRVRITESGRQVLEAEKALEVDSSSN